MKDGTVLTVQRVVDAIPGVLDKLRKQIGAARFDAGKFDLAARLFREMTEAAEFPEFLTVAAYDYID
jgi:malate synthase